PYDCIFCLFLFLQRRLCGKKHAVRKQIECDTNTSIKVPPPDTCDDIIITGGTEEDVESAHLRISATVNAMRQHEHYTHFVCFPLNNPKLGAMLDEFKEIVMKSCTGRGLESSLFASKQKLHLTIGMLVLLDAKEQSIAQKVLDSCKDLITNILDDAPLMVRVHGLEIMNDDPSVVDVLYAKVSAYNKEGPSRSSEKCKLQQLADGVAQRFLDSGLMLRQQERGRGPEHVKLHMTLMNTRLREHRFATENTSLPPAPKPRNSFDATAVMKRNRDFAFGRIHVPSINVVDPHNCDSDERTTHQIGEQPPTAPRTTSQFILRLGAVHRPSRRPPDFIQWLTTIPLSRRSEDARRSRKGRPKRDQPKRMLLLMRPRRSAAGVALRVAAKKERRLPPRRPAAPRRAPDAEGLGRLKQTRTLAAMRPESSQTKLSAFFTRHRRSVIRAGGA
ncbi:hypothetical protein V5799_026605, partial [Amblyomma americanum]